MDLPVVARGAGTGLSGGALPHEQGLLLSLAKFAGSRVKVRFRAVSDRNTGGRGWYIDDVRIDETANPSIPYPFADDMEGPDTQDNWISSSWELVTTDYHSPDHCWTDSPEGPPPSAGYNGGGYSLTLAGAIYITLVCLMPEFLIVGWNVPFYFGGTSLLIVVVVVMDFMAQVQAHVMSHQYEGLMKKANLKGIGGTGMPR